MEKEINALHQKETDFRKLICDFPGAVYRSAYNRQWSLEYVSANILQITGYDALEFYSGPKRTLESLVYDEDMDLVTSTIEKSLADQNPFVMEYRIMHKSGDLKWIYEKGKSLRGERLPSREGILMDVSQGKNVNQNLEYLATHDSLTGLPNRTLFFDRLSQAMAKAKRSEFPMALFFVDLDDFKSINDTYGHMAGDAVLIETCRRLKECLRESDTIARLGGDEFVILLENTSHEHYTTTVAEKIHDALTPPVALRDGTKIRVTASIGISPYIKGDKSDSLLQKADAAMYQAKKKGKSNFQVYARL